ncbi:MAG: 50S ribosomal protein L35 [Spiroplasmataceae bacterium]|jgi:large subunit ribosomal protein L35|nr:50S ribosomal protein L35 [Spiroplasmataceae bacterium]
MSAIKPRSKKALVKRTKILASGKVKHWRAYTSHLAYNKTTKQKRHLRKTSLLDKSDYKRIKKLIIK